MPHERSLVASITCGTIGRRLTRLGISVAAGLHPDLGDPRRPPERIHAAWPGHMVHLSVKKVSKIPDGE